MQNMKIKIVAANWKMNPASRKEAEALTRSVIQAEVPETVRVVLFPPFVFLSAVADVLRAGTRVAEIEIGAQSLFWEKRGAFTGEVSAEQIRSVGCGFVLVGHSERRALGERDAVIAKKTQAALSAGLKVILCVGESKRELGGRAKPPKKAKEFVLRQLTADIGEIQHSLLKNLIVAYEPVWAISTSRSGQEESPEDAALMIREIKNTLRTGFALRSPTVLYGGSVSRGNAVSFLSPSEIDGVLVGGASLQPGDFAEIVRAASRTR